MIRGTSSAIQRLSAHQDALQQDINKLLSDAESKVEILFDHLLCYIRQCKVNAKHATKESDKEQMNKLKASLADREKDAYNVKQLVANFEQHLAPSATMFDRSVLINKLPDIQKETRQPDTDAITYLQTDISEWKSELTAWLQHVSNALNKAMKRIPDLTDDDSYITRKLIAIRPLEEC
jgi:hypothetical protein